MFVLIDSVEVERTSSPLSLVPAAPRTWMKFVALRSVAVATPEIVTLSKSVCPSTSKSPAISTLALASIAAANVATPAWTLIPFARIWTPVLAVTIPSESILVTSS